MDPLLFRSPLSFDLGLSSISCLLIVVDLFLLVFLLVVCVRVLVMVMVMCYVVLMNVLVAFLTSDDDGDDEKYGWKNNDFLDKP
jgi:hypothetical protein